MKKTEELIPANGRRKFISNTAKAAIAFTIIPRYVLGRGYMAPSDKITLGFIGTGKQSRSLLNSFKDKAQIIAGSDVDTQKLALFQSLTEKAYAANKGKADYKSFTAYNDFREVINRKDIDAVVIATPDHWHAMNTIMSAHAGKHVYCEKPLAHTIEEGRAMVNAMKKNNRILQTGSMQRSWKNFRHACELVRNGYVGDIKEVLVTVGTAAVPCDLKAEPVPPNVNWNRWVGPAPYHDFNAVLSPPVEQDIYPMWRLYKEYGGGILSDWGAHMFDIAQWGLGMDRSGPVKFYPPDGNQYKTLTMVYDNGVVMKHEDFKRGYAVRFIGTKGTLDISRSFLDSNPANIVSAEIKPNEIHLYNTDDHYQDWLDAIRSGKQPICDAETGHRSSSVCCLANIAYWLKRPLEWNPERERFRNDREANLLLKGNLELPKGYT
ncbi:MAG: gfo/Idh/MocA family oxidoreductase [Chitinophagaceae bacterium]|nr:gfo/Idh/MocA family oxidoreductase [Chitinophagaceae bacterium]